MASSSSRTQFFYAPEDPSVLYLQGKHISSTLLAEGETYLFHVRRTETKVWDVPIHPSVRPWLDTFGFGGILDCGKPMKLDNELITALIERWRPETHTFHLPVGEATVTLQDVQVLWGLRADGRAFTGRDSPVGHSGWPSKCRELLGWMPDVDTETKQGGILMTALIKQARIPLEYGLPTYVYIQRARIHALILLGGLILPDTTGCKVPFMWLNGLENPDEVADISWGSAALSYLYHYLCEASIGKRKELGGPMMLLQLWAWERMPTLRPSFVEARLHQPYTPCGARWNGVTHVGNAPRFSVVHYRDQISLIKPGQFLWTPYTDCTLPEYCNDVNGCYLCDTYLVCWQFVEAHEAGRVQRQFNRFQRIPEYVDRMLNNADHLRKNDRRGKKGHNWANQHQFFIAEWDRRYDRFRDAFDPQTMSMNIPMNPGYMAWYNKITVTYLTQPGAQSTVGMNESASCMRLLVETLQGIWHMTDEHEQDPRMRRIREMASNALEATNQADVMQYPASQRRDVDMSRPPTQSIPRAGQRGVRTGGHGYTRHYRMSQPQPEYVEPEPMNPEYDPPQWSIYPGQESQSQWSRPHSYQGQEESQWNAARASCDSFFHGYQIVAPTQEGEDEQEGEEEEEEEEEDEVLPEVRPRAAAEGSSRPAAEGSSSGRIGKYVNRMMRGLSTRTTKGKKPSKYTPSGYK